MAQPSRANPARAGHAKPHAAAPSLRVLPGGLGTVSLGPLQDMLGFHLRLAQEASFSGFARRTGDSGLKPGHFAALLVIRENPGLSQTALGAAVGRDKSTLTPKLTELERRGLIRRDRAAADRRSYALRLTTEGEEALAALQRHAAAHDAALDRLVGAENRQAFLDTLRRLTAGLDSDDR